MVPPAGKEGKMTKTKWVHGVALILLTLLFCIACNMAHVLIDTERMRENATQAVDMLWIQEGAFDVIGGMPSTRHDNYTTILKVKTAAYTGGESFWHRVFGGLRAEFEPTGEMSDWDGFCTYGDGRDTGRGGLSYSRYWHGYILPLRILLSFTTLSNIGMMMYALEFALILLCALLMQRRGLTKAIVPWGLGVFIMVPITMAACIQFVPVMLTFLLASAALLYGYERIERFVGMPVFFFLIGLFTCYYDLLTAPTVTLSFPLTLLILMEGKKGQKKLLSTVFLSVFAWGVGYVGMYLFKFLLNELVLGTGAGGAFAQIRIRMASHTDGNYYTRPQALLRNVSVLTSKHAYLVVFGIMALYILGSWVKKGHMGRPQWALLVPCLIPLVFMLATSNHIYEHYYFTYRNLSGVIFAGASFLLFRQNAFETVKKL